MRPTITVVIPVFNVALYVERCVQSVMRQSYPAAECIIVDDASTDDSIQRCERLIADFKGTTRFIVLHHKNQGFICLTKSIIGCVLKFLFSKKSVRNYLKAIFNYKSNVTQVNIENKDNEEK